MVSYLLVIQSLRRSIAFNNNGLKLFVLLLSPAKIKKKV